MVYCLPNCHLQPGHTSRTPVLSSGPGGGILEAPVRRGGCPPTPHPPNCCWLDFLLAGTCRSSPPAHPRPGPPRRAPSGPAQLQLWFCCSLSGPLLSIPDAYEMPTPLGLRERSQPAQGSPHLSQNPSPRGCPRSNSRWRGRDLGLGAQIQNPHLTGGELWKLPFPPYRGRFSFPPLKVIGKLDPLPVQEPSLHFPPLLDPSPTSQTSPPPQTLSLPEAAAQKGQGWGGSGLQSLRLGFNTNANCGSQNGPAWLHS